MEDNTVRKINQIIKDFKPLKMGLLLFISPVRFEYKGVLEEERYIGVYLAPIDDILDYGNYKKEIKRKKLGDNTIIYELGHFLKLCYEGDITLLTALVTPFITPEGGKDYEPYIDFFPSLSHLSFLVSGNINVGLEKLIKKEKRKIVKLTYLLQTILFHFGEFHTKGSFEVLNEKVKEYIEKHNQTDKITGYEEILEYAKKHSNLSLLPTNEESLRYFLKEIRYKQINRDY